MRRGAGTGRVIVVGVCFALAVAATLTAAVPALPVTAALQEPAAVCRARIDLVRWDLDIIQAADGIGGERPVETYAALAGRLSMARDRLDEGRTRESVNRLKEFESMVVALRDEVPARLSLLDAQRLMFGDHDRTIDEGVNGAIICVWLMRGDNHF